MSVADDIRTAFGLLSVVPLGSRTPHPPIPGRTSVVFPWVGLLFGFAGLALLEGFDRLAILADSSVYPAIAGLTSVVVLVVWAIGSRLLHWDGLADTADGMGVLYDRERRLSVMRDSSIGAFGVTAIVLVAAASVFALQGLILSDSAIAVWWVLWVPVAGRLSASFAAWLGKPAQADGLGVSVIGPPGLGGAALASVGVVFAATPSVLVGGTWMLASIAASIVIAGAIPHLIALRVGGVTGDVMGASVVLSECAVLCLGLLVSVLL